MSSRPPEYPFEGMGLFWAGLKNHVPMIWVKPWGAGGHDAGGHNDPMDAGGHNDPSAGGHNDPPLQTAIAEGRLLVVSPFDDAIVAPSARRAAWCNEYVMHHCEKLVVGYLKPGGMLACLLSDAPPELDVEYSQLATLSHSTPTR